MMHGFSSRSDGGAGLIRRGTQGPAGVLVQYAEEPQEAQLSQGGCFRRCSRESMHNSGWGRTGAMPKKYGISFWLWSPMLLFSGVWGLAESSPSFRNDVLPVMTKMGCNSGSCHGAATGKKGFKLSLRGYDPEADYKVLTREALGRRTVKTAPARSLILMKPTLTLPHGGGKRFDTDSEAYQIIANWIAAGLPPPSSADPTIVGIDVLPVQIDANSDQEIQLTVKALYSDGSGRDVTRWAKFSSTDESVAQVDEDGAVATQGYGEASISVLYSSKVSSARVAVAFPHSLDTRIFERAPRNNYIDELVLKKLEKLHIPPSKLSTDAEFLRRVYLDTLGILPSPSEVDEFMADRRADKRSRLIEQFFERREFVDYWSYKWSDLLLVSSRKLVRGAMWSYYNWVRDSVAENKPWDRFAWELVTAKGSTLENGASNFYTIHQEPIDLTETLSQAFLGISLTCARCHNHPQEKWTQDDYYGMLSLFSRVSLKSHGEMKTDLPKGDDVTVFSSTMGEINHPRRGRPLPPRPLDGEILSLEATKDRRTHFAEWLTSPQNPYFARVIVNRVWARFMGRGLVEPVDDLRTTNPASHEELFQAVTQDFVSHGFDLRHLMRTILNSATYQLSSDSREANAHDERYYSHHLLRRLPAEVILDAVSQVTGVPEEFEGYPAGFRALQLPDVEVASYFLTAFGRPPRINTCECERQDESNVAQALHLINGSTLDHKLSKEGNVVDRLLDEKLSAQELIEKVYKLTLSRDPRPEELAALLPAVTVIDRPTVEDLLWSLLTSKSFLFNR